MDFEVSRTNEVSTREVHYATVNVGNDTIENAEYYISSHSEWFAPKEMNCLEKTWDAIESLYYAVKRNVSRVYWNCRYGFQRMFKGYDSVDTFSTFDKFVERYTNILKELRNRHYGYPLDLTEEKWDDILDEMIYHLHYMDEETVIKELEKDVPDDWYASSKTVWEVMDKHKNEFFKLFSEYFYNLWD